MELEKKKTDHVSQPLIDLFNNTAWGDSQSRDTTTHTLHLSSYYRKKITGRMRIHVLATGRGPLSLYILSGGLESPLSPVLLLVFLGCTDWHFHCHSS